MNVNVFPGLCTKNSLVYETIWIASCTSLFVCFCIQYVHTYIVNSHALMNNNYYTKWLMNRPREEAIFNSVRAYVRQLQPNRPAGPRVV